LHLAKTEAKLLHDKISKKTYNDDDFIRIFATRSRAQLNAAFNHYKDEFGKDINKVTKLILQYSNSLYYFPFFLPFVTLQICGKETMYLSYAPHSLLSLEVWQLPIGFMEPV